LELVLEKIGIYQFPLCITGSNWWTLPPCRMFTSISRNIRDSIILYCQRWNVYNPYY